MNRHGSVRLAWSCICGVLVAITIWFVSRSGPLLTPDSMSYVGAAHALAEQRQLRVPVGTWDAADSTMVLKQFPPGYPALLAAALHAGVTSASVVRALNAAAAFALVALGVWLCSAATNDSWPVRLAAPVMILAVRAMPTALASAWSEPLFLVAVVTTLLLMVRYPAKSWTYGTTAALGNAVRYAGVSLLLSAVTWAMWEVYTRQASLETDASRVGAAHVVRRQRIAQAIGAAVIAVTPGALFNGWWLWRARHFGVQTPVATTAWTGNLPAAVGEGIRTVSAQLVPLSTALTAWVRVDVACVLLVGVAALIVQALRRTRRASASAVPAHNCAPRTILAALTIAVSYAGMLVYARLFVGGSIPFDDRLLAPLVLMGGIATLIALHIWSRQATRAARRGTAAAFACWIAAAAWQSFADVRSLLDDRDDYGSDYWTDTPAAVWLRTNGRTHALFSNDPVATYFITGRPSRMVPNTFRSTTASDFLERLRASGGVLIEYSMPLEDMVDARELARQTGLCIVVTSEVGTVWRVPTGPMELCTTGADSVRSPEVPSPSAPTLPAPGRKSP